MWFVMQERNEKYFRKKDAYFGNNENVNNE